MVDTSSQTKHSSEVDTALLDVELFLKYQAPERAVNRLRGAIESNPRSIPLRERLREICISQSQKDEAARQCLTLASLYIERDEFDSAYDRLLEAKQLDERINIAGGLDAIRRARHPQTAVAPAPVAKRGKRSHAALAGDLAVISIFDAIQVIENAKLGGSLVLTNEAQTGRVLFNAGRIVDAVVGHSSGEKAFKEIVEISTGDFEFHKSEKEFAARIKAASNTNLILDSLRQLDEERQ
ncbi:MAG TPA: DUF4388 domain-containing protein [Pyrinomonadaceae bacterium]|nr:DUF4388 domain-containing protein [Pyrinomonadaceae bacterium]